jgi:hypothetical protein
MNLLRKLVPVCWWTRKCDGAESPPEQWHTGHLTGWGRFALGLPLHG